MAWLAPTRAEGKYGFTAEEIAAQLAAAEARQPGTARERLHTDDLILARACARGSEPAWEEFAHRFRSRLRQAALALTHDRERAEELADGLWGDLYGLRERDGQRVSKLDSYLGLGSLEGWLCALLAQAHIDGWRRERRLVRLDENEPIREVLAPARQEEECDAQGVQPHLEAALSAVFAHLGGPERLLLSFYYLDGKTLAEIGTLLGVHESTVSRRLERALAGMRRQVKRELRLRGLRWGAADAVLQLDHGGLRLDIRNSLRVANSGHSVRS